MKLGKHLKFILLSTLGSLYLTGVLTWVLTHWFYVNSGLGAEPSPLRLWWLQLHGFIGLWFLCLFGYLFHSHVKPAWRRRRRLKSGVALTAVLIFLCATVPGLYYIGHEATKEAVVWVHTYVGLAAIAVFFVHYLD